MSRIEQVNYPSDEIYKQIWGEKKNTEHIILWMLKNNEVVEWSDFKMKPVSIPISTLSNYMNTLKDKDLVEKVGRGSYKITSKGESRYNELSKAKKERRLSYPPKVIRDGRNHDHIILWMAYNNNFLKWSDFFNSKAPIFINQSSLSKNMKKLLDPGFLRKDDQKKEYKITNTGKAEYSRILKLYDLDRQSILDEESKRIAEFTKKTITFFEKYKISNEDIKFRFLNNVLKLPHDKLKGSLESEEDFNKILLFLSINHPDYYPEYVSPEEFSKKYLIDRLDLEFNIRRIVEKSLYSIKFFRLEFEESKYYFFQENEKLEKVLSAVSEDHITKFTYLNKLYEKTAIKTSRLTLGSTVDAILDEICDHLFNSELKESLRNFLPEYIKNLAYRIETEKKLVDHLDKLEGVAWRNIPEVFQSYGSRYDLVEQSQFKYSIDFSILKVLKIFTTPEIESMLEEAKHQMKKKNYDDVLDKVNGFIKKEPDNVDFLFLKAIVLSLYNRHKEATRFLKEKVRVHLAKKDDDITASYYFILVYCYMTLDRFDKAIRNSKKSSTDFPDHPLSYVMRALILGYKIVYHLEIEEARTDQVLDDIDKAISLDSLNLNKAKYYHFKSFVLKQLKKFEDALDAIELGIELDPKDINLRFMKYNILYSSEKIDEAIEIVKQDVGEFPEKEIKLITHIAYLYKKKDNLDEGIKLIDELNIKYPENHETLNNKIYWHFYRGEKEEALKTGKLLIELDPEDGNFHDSFAEVLTEFGEYNEALKQIDKALELEPLGWFTYNTYLQSAKCYKAIGKYDLARESLEKGERATQTCFCGIQMREEWKEKREVLLAEIEELEAKS